MDTEPEAVVEVDREVADLIPAMKTVAEEAAAEEVNHFFQVLHDFILKKFVI